MKLKNIIFLSIIAYLMLITGLKGEVHYFKGEKLIKCRVQLPDNYNKEKSYPLVIGLHGHGGSTEGFSSLWNGFKKHDFIYACPEGPYNVFFKNSKTRNSYAWLLSVKDRELWEKGDKFLENYILNVVKELSNKYSVSKVFLFGFSAGATGSYVIGIRNPDIFSGIVAVSGSLPLYKNYSLFTKEHIKNGNKLPVLILHGKKDKAIKYKIGVNVHKILKSYGYNVDFKSYKQGHTITKKVLAMAYKWIKSK